MPSQTFHGDSITFKEIRESRIQELISHYEKIFPPDSLSARRNIPRKISSPCLPKTTTLSEFKKSGNFKSSSDSESSPVTSDVKFWIEPHTQKRSIDHSKGLRPKLERRKPVTGPHPQLKKRPLQVIEVNQSSNGGQSTSLSADKNRISTLKIFFEEKDRKSKHESLILSGHYLEAQSTLLQPERFPLPLDKTCTKDRSSLEKWATTGLRFKSKAMALQFITSCG